ncbi:carbohydrate-binding domain-containing protein [Butyrivibrio sp. MC2021]|uniref:carbohydrate-binding domain-containing protein n=1 Tax=Butyrivibrio sp. MC2021 TaxID=1408306 RepID=UPI0004798D7A|nr:carbohydrate-binding domain-containing protein [Butyrivibrio sp. MC2021]
MRRIAILLLMFLALVICWRIGASHESHKNEYQYVSVPLSETDLQNQLSYLQITDLDQVIEGTDMKSLCFDNSSEIVEITEGGDYLLSGKLSGMIHIDAKEQNVHLFLNNLEVISKSGPAIYCENADKLVITLVDGTQNTVSDSGDYRKYDDLEACIYSDCDMTFNGTGTVKVNGYYKDAIRSKDMVKILNGTYTIKCKRTAVHGNDGVFVKDGVFMISSEKNGFKTTKSGADGRGSLIISGGEMDIVAGQYAFVTTKANLYLYDCTIRSRSIVDTYSIGGAKKVQVGCVDER